MGIATEEEFRALEARLSMMEQKLGVFGGEVRNVVKAEIKEQIGIPRQSDKLYGVYTGLCIDTVDIWKQNRIRFFCPALHNPKESVKKMPWAYPVSAMGGFDDCGLTWVPPAGSTVCVLFEAGQRSSPFYIGTTWHRNRGSDGQHNWGFNIDEYYKIWEGRRNGYLVGPDDGSQVFPPWNTESYNGFDLNSIVDFASNPEAQKRITYPNIYGFKTPEKHMLKMVDGDHRCNHRWKRLEIMSSCGNWLMMKDDHLHYAGQWAHPDCPTKDGDTECYEGANTPAVDLTRNIGLGSKLLDRQQRELQDALAASVKNASTNFGKKKEQASCQGTESNQQILGGHPSTGHPESVHFDNNKGANPYFKQKSECRPYRGPQTPLNPKVDLPQTGIQLMSISGHTFVMDDSVEEPNGDMDWERGTKPFDFGCNNHFAGRTYWRSATGHSIEMSDLEQPNHQANCMMRSENNYIRILSAGGNKIELNDHTIGQPGCVGCPPNVAGAKRGIFLGSTSGHTFEMNDEENEQCSPCRKDNGYNPVRKAKKAFIRTRTGYGLEFMMHDDNRQEETVKQYIQIFAPHKDNKDRGPHIMRLQESPSGPGLVFLRAGGNYIVMTYDNKYEIIGDIQKNPADKIEMITRRKIVYTKDVHINVTEKTHVVQAKERILLLAGADSAPTGSSAGDQCGPASGPVLVYVGGCIRLSDRVYASSSMAAPAASLFMMSPMVKCPTDSGECGPDGMVTSGGS